MSGVPLGALLADGRVSYGIVQPGTARETGVPVVRAGDLRGGRIEVRSPLRVAPETSARHARTLLRGGELLFSVVGAVGETAIVPNELAGWNVARAVAVLRPGGVSTRWLHYALQLTSVRRQIDSFLNTTVQPTLNLADLLRLELPRTPLSEQHAIAEVLGALDDKIVANSAAVYSVDSMLTTEFTSRLPLVELRETTLSAIANVVLGGTPSRARPEYWTDGTVAWLNSGAVNATRIFEPSARITPDALVNSAAKLMPVGSTLLAITGATLGQIARLEITAAGNQSIVGVWSDDVAMNTWLYFAIQTRLNVLLSRATGAAQQHVSKGDVNQLTVPIPGRADLEDFSGTARPLLEVAANVERENRTLAAVRDALLPQLMYGRLSVRDADVAVSDAGA